MRLGAAKTGTCQSFLVRLASGRRYVRLQSRSFARLNQSFEIKPQLQPALLRLSAITSEGDFRSGEMLQHCIHCELVNCTFQFHKRGQPFVGADDETVSVAMRVNDPNCAPMIVDG